MYVPIRCALALTVTLVLSVPVIGEEARTSAAEIDEAVQRSIPFLEREGNAWIEKRNCVSCHQVPFMLWGLNAAQSAGFEVDDESLQKTSDWSLTWQSWQNLENTKESDEASTAQGNVDTLYFLLLGREGYREDERNADAMENMRRLILANQQPDGSFKPGGQLPLQRRPLEETTQVASMWALLALPPEEADADRASARRKALDYLDAEWTPRSTEWLAARLLLDRQLGDKAKTEARTRALLESQNDDGGWGWLLAEESDAFGTGVALYAVSRLGQHENMATVRRAQAFLTSTQGDDGAWQVPGTKASAKGKPRDTATYWGTAWAVIGLCETKPVAD